MEPRTAAPSLIHACVPTCNTNSIHRVGGNKRDVSSFAPDMRAHHTELCLDGFSRASDVSIHSLRILRLPMAGPVSYPDWAPDGILSELDEKFYTGHDSPRHLCTIFKVSLFGHCIRSWQHQSSPALKWVSSGSRASGSRYVQLSKPGPAILGTFRPR